jgi:hypothetical protein
MIGAPRPAAAPLRGPLFGFLFVLRHFFLGFHRHGRAAIYDDAPHHHRHHGKQKKTSRVRRTDSTVDTFESMAWFHRRGKGRNDEREDDSFHSLHFLPVLSLFMLRSVSGPATNPSAAAKALWSKSKRRWRCGRRCLPLLASTIMVIDSVADSPNLGLSSTMNDMMAVANRLAYSPRPPPRSRPFLRTGSCASSIQETVGWHNRDSGDG